MTSTILLTGATDGIGLEAAKLLATDGHTLLLHGRSPDKLERVAGELSELPGVGTLHTYVADLSSHAATAAMADAVQHDHASLDVLINNAGVFRTRQTTTPGGLDVRFAVNTLAPHVLMTRLMPLMSAAGRVVNLSSAAQRPVDLEALAGRRRLDDMGAYAQSKLALTMWSCHTGRTLGDDSPVIVAVNPGSMLGTRMVKEAFGVAGGDVGIGARILARAALADDFADATGAYFDNDSRRFAPPHPDALDPARCEALLRAMADIPASAWA